MKDPDVKLTAELPLTEERWQAILCNDACYDDKFIYAVKTTGICCRPSCKSRPPKLENVRIFHNVQAALSAKYRPCKRCKPSGQRLPEEEWVAQITRYIETHYAEPITLEALANLFHGSPYHLHRTFKRITGSTPTAYVQQTRINRAIEQLLTTDRSLSDIACTVGIPNTAYFVTLFKKITGHTPAAYRLINSNLSTEEETDHGSDI
ncbi:AraC family transcriptional regulator [Tumebacillus algifaecis]|uniref:AraC family transcriptional regulator n=1 Tax=Tumebacillus algifaecis TaxID=1214604 RepID=A0A223CXW2_9BACL|nr:bifunctional transcriptional activator/DNA repair enzyme AdaA [Tumebacillus algifaecis]ASS74229.1 AraC family transcriptional regulator [Tumebacillus algifaecis]